MCAGSYRRLLVLDLHSVTTLARYMSLNCRPLQDLNPKYRYTPQGVLVDDIAARWQAPFAMLAHSVTDTGVLEANASADLVPAWQAAYSAARHSTAQQHHGRRRDCTMQHDQTTA